MKKRLKMILVLFVFTFCASCLCAPVQTQAAAKIPKKVYKNIKGNWYAQSSSGGYNIKFTRTRVKYYNRSTNKLVRNCKILKVEKVKSGTYKGEYKIYYQNAYGKSCYITCKKGKKGFDYFDVHDDGSLHYSGSSSLFKGKWEM